MTVAPALRMDGAPSHASAQQSYSSTSAPLKVAKRTRGFGNALQLDRRSTTVFGLQLGALIAAGIGQACVTARPWLGTAVFCVAAGLFFIAERSVPPPSNPEVSHPSPVARSVWVLLGLGCAICFVTGILVKCGVTSTMTQPVWLLGLVLLAASAVLSRESRSRQTPRSRILLAVCLALFVISAALFAWHVSSVPPEVHNDEAEVGNDAIRLLTERPLNLFTVGWYNLPMFHAVPAALGMKLFGMNLLGLRIPSVILGIAAVFALLGFVRCWWGVETALLAAFVLASQRFFIHLSRTGFHYIGTPFLAATVAWLASEVWCNLSLSAAIGCGIALGLGIQGYYPSRLVPVLLALTWTLWLLRSERTLLRARLTRFAVIVIVALATAAPMIGYFGDHWAQLWSRTQGTSIFKPESLASLRHEYGTDHLAVILLIQLQRAFALFNFRGDTSVQYGYREGGLFEPVSAALFVLGVAALCARARRRPNLLILIWVIVPVITGAALTINTPSVKRASGMIPFAVVVVAYALQRILASVRTVLPGSRGRWVATLAAVATLAVVYADNVYTYFIVHAPRLRSGPAVAMCEFMQAQGAGKTFYMIRGRSDFSLNHGTVRFLTYGYDKRDTGDLTTYLQTHRIDPSTSVFLIMPEGHDLVPSLVAAVGPLRVEEHHAAGGGLLFYTGIPQGTPS